MHDYNTCPYLYGKVKNAIRQIQRNIYIYKCIFSINIFIFNEQNLFKDIHHIIYIPLYYA